MTTFTDVFGTGVSATDVGYSLSSLSASQNFEWAFNSAGSQYVVSDILDLSASVAVSIGLPSASAVSVGKSVLLRNSGAFTVTVKDYNQTNVVCTLAAGETKFAYVKDNTTATGVWGSLTFGTGTSSADANTLVGAGLKVVGATLNVNNLVVTSLVSRVVTSADRGKTIAFTGGTVDCTFPSAASVAAGFCFTVKNNGTGIVTFVPVSGNTVDQAYLNPGESVDVTTDGANWVTSGYGRSNTFQTTKLNKVVLTSDASLTLTNQEASNKIINFVGTATQDLDCIVPAIPSVYYISSSVAGGYSITLKTSAGTGITFGSGTTMVVVCDGVNVYNSVNSTYSASLSVGNGSVTAPSMTFLSDPTTGLFSPSGNHVAITSSGLESASFSRSHSSVAGHFSVGIDHGTGDPNPLGSGYIYQYNSGGIVWYSDVGINSVFAIEHTSGATPSIDINTGNESNATMNIRAGGNALGFVLDSAASVINWSINSTTEMNVLTLRSNGRLSSTKGLVDASHDISTLTTGFSLTIADTCSMYIIDGAGTLATGTVTLPAASAGLAHGSVFTLAANVTVTALTVSAGVGTTINSVPTTLAAYTSAAWKYHINNNRWYRIR